MSATKTPTTSTCGGLQRQLGLRQGRVGQHRRSQRGWASRGDHRGAWLHNYWDGPGGVDHGRAEVLAWTGTTSPRVVQLNAGRGVLAGASYGFSVDRVGLIEGSGRVIVGAPWDGTKGVNAGMACVVAPGKAWIKTLQVFGDSASDYLGYRVAGYGDLDRDGNADFVATAPWDDPVAGVEDSGSLFIYSYSSKTKKVAQIRHRYSPVNYYTDGRCQKKRGLEYGYRLAVVGDVDQDDYADLLVGCTRRYWTRYGYPYYNCRSLLRYQGRVYLDSPVKQYLYADRGHAIISKATGSTSVIYSLQAGKAYAGQLMLFLGTGPNNNSFPPSCGIKIGTTCIPVNPRSLWFPLALSGSLHPVVAAVGNLGA